jgi:hypothetical protein
MAFNASTDFNLNAAMATVGSPNVSYATNLTGITRPAPAQDIDIHRRVLVRTMTTWK